MFIVEHTHPAVDGEYQGKNRGVSGRDLGMVVCDFWVLVWLNR
jgi:hypothetical protein